MTTKINKAIARALIAAVLLSYCGLSELANAQASQSPQSTATAPSGTQSAPATTDRLPASGPSNLPTPSSDVQSQTAPSAQSEAQQSATAAQSSADAQQNNAPTGIVNPSEGPLTPVPPSQQESLPNAPSTSQQPSATAPTQHNRTFQQPVGAAGAQVGPTAGGAASKPAGNAIAPAKQRQTRSFLIKLGAVAAAGVAIGTIVALSRGTSGNPPGTR